MTKYVFNMFTSIKNGQQSKKSSVIIKRTNLCEFFLKLLWDQGFICGYKIVDCSNRKLEIFLSYSKTGTPVISSIKFVSKPSRKIYLSVKQIWKLNSSEMFMIFSTTQGLMTMNECRQNKIGGEPLIIIN